MPFRKALKIAWEQYLDTVELIDKYQKCMEKAAKQHEQCERLQALEGVGPMNAINLFISLGCSELATFKKGRDASACIGLTSIQHSSGGVVKLGSICKHVKNTSLRSCLIVGAMSAVQQAARRMAKTQKDLWIQQLVERRGKQCAAALAIIRQAREVLVNSH